MNKKGDKLVLPETLKIIIAVICIFLLVYLAWSLYDLFMVKSDLAQARETLKQIKGEIELLDELDERNYLVVSPERWYFISYQDKLCMCSGDDIAEGKEKCCSLGATENNDKEVIIDSICKTSRLEEENCISFTNLPMNLQLVKEDNLRYVRTESSSTAGESFDRLLEFKGDGDKTVLELSQEYVNDLTDMSSADEIRDLVKEFFKGQSVQFQIKEGEEYIRLQVLLDNYGKFPSQGYTFCQTALERRKEIKDEEGKSYFIILRVGEYKPSCDA